MKTIVQAYRELGGIWPSNDDKRFLYYNPNVGYVTQSFPPTTAEMSRDYVGHKDEFDLNSDHSWTRLKPLTKVANQPDAVNHPPHYTSHPSGVECIQVTEHMNFCLGNAVKYLWRAGVKSSSTHLEDLRKARWYIDREIQRLEKESAK
jgi:hypothetical protein